MKKYKFFLGCTLVVTFLVCTPVQAQLFAPAVTVQASLTDSSIIIAVGETSLAGTLHGYSAGSLFEDMSTGQAPEDLGNNTGFKELIDTLLFKNLRVFPLLSSAIITHVDNVTIFNTTLFETLPENLTNSSDFLPPLQSFQDVTIHIDHGMTLFGTDNKTITVQCDAPYALSGLMEFPVNEEMTIPVIGMLTQTASSLAYTGNTSLLYPIMNSTSITLSSTDGTVLLETTGTENFFYLKDQNLHIQDTSPVHLYPTNTSDQTYLQILIHPADPSTADITSLLLLLDEIQFGEQSIDFPIDLGNDSFMGDMIETISPVANGFLVMMNYSSLSLNNQLPESQPFIFTRAQNIEMTVASTKNQSTQLISEANLVFLGSHFYVPQAPEDNNGLFLPILPALFWIFAIGFYVASKKYPLPRTNETLDKKLKIYGLIIHIIMLVTSFALLDLIISSYFGLSFITSLFNQSFYLITLGLLGFQLLLWTLGYICCSLPLHFIFKTLFRFIGVKKSGAALSKAISTLGIPLFAGFYVLLLINILLLFIDIPTLTFPL